MASIPISACRWLSKNHAGHCCLLHPMRGSLLPLGLWRGPPPGRGYWAWALSGRSWLWFRLLWGSLFPSHHGVGEAVLRTLGGLSEDHLLRLLCLSLVHGNVELIILWPGWQGPRMFVPYQQTAGILYYSL